MFHVKQNSELSNLGEFLLSTDLEFDDQMMRQLNVYMQLISLWSKKINLVSKDDTKNLVKKHLIPCLWFSEIIKKEKVNTLLDIGSGAGFPGIVIKIINPNLNVALIDSISDSFFTYPLINPAVNPSPAPVVSTTDIFGAKTCPLSAFDT